MQVLYRYLGHGFLSILDLFFLINLINAERNSKKSKIPAIVPAICSKNQRNNPKTSKSSSVTVTEVSPLKKNEGTTLR
jgi:hypothetical protein